MAGLVRVARAPEKAAHVYELMRRAAPCLEAERRDLGGREPNARDRVDPSRGERPPRSLNLRRRDVRLAEEGREPVKPLDHRVPTPKPAAQRGEGDAVLGIDGIDGGVNPDNVQEPRDFADHRAADSTGVMGPAFTKNLRVGPRALIVRDGSLAVAVDSESHGRRNHVVLRRAGFGCRTDELAGRRIRPSRGTIGRRS